MNQEEQRRVVVLSRVLEGHVIAKDAAQLLDVSVRHCRRLLAAFRHEGAAALAHGNRGRPPQNRLPPRVRRRVLRLAQTTYTGFNDHHLTEMLIEEQALHISRPTIRRWLRDAGLPSPHTRRPPRHRRRRERMPQPGLLLQWDGSHHDWLEGRGPRLVLHGAIDDATNEVPAAFFCTQEDAVGYFVVLRDTVRTCGIPVAIYGDRHGIITKTRALTLDEQLQGLPRPLTQVSRALRELGIRWIPASSPQAKGRIERLWGTFQDRLVSELRQARARTLEDANAVLARFLPRYNARFALAPADPHSAYRPLAPDHVLEDICCFAYERRVANDNTVRLGEYLLQILPGPRRQSYAKARVVVREHLNGTLSISYHGQRLVIHALHAPSTRPRPTGLLRARQYDRPSPAAQPAPGKVQERVRARREASRSPLLKAKRRRPTGRGNGSWTPPPDHPWRHLAKQAVRRKRLKEAGVTFSLNT
ncbi:MAG: ISNCY family transposase [bacterium]